MAHSAQGVNASARLDRLPMTSFQRNMFIIIALAWLFDSIDLGMMTFLLAPVREYFGLTAATSGFVASASFIGMFIAENVSLKQPPEQCVVCHTVCRHFVTKKIY